MCVTTERVAPVQASTAETTKLCNLVHGALTSISQLSPTSTGTLRGLHADPSNYAVVPRSILTGGCADLTVGKVNAVVTTTARIGCRVQPALAAQVRRDEGLSLRAQNARSLSHVERVHGIGRTLTDRERFALFVKILLRCLDKVDPELRRRADAVVRDYTRRHRQGENGYEDLEMVVGRRLREIVRVDHWLLAQRCLDMCCRRRWSPSASCA